MPPAIFVYQDGQYGGINGETNGAHDDEGRKAQRQQSDQALHHIH
jgi:hypothetical protein